jgi:C_GCAxxG_C_C family probable redox protein
MMVPLVHSKSETIRLAESFAEQGFLCSESVLLAISQALGIECKQIPRIATGFGAGIARCGELCGALSGAIMGLGLCFGRYRVQDTPEDQTPYEFAQTMTNLFRARFGHTRCDDLINLDLSKEQALETYRKNDLWSTICRDIVKTTTGLAYDLLSSNAK